MRTIIYGENTFCIGTNRRRIGLYTRPRLRHPGTRHIYIYIHKNITYVHTYMHTYLCVCMYVCIYTHKTTSHPTLFAHALAKLLQPTDSGISKSSKRTCRAPHFPCAATIFSTIPNAPVTLPSWCVWDVLAWVLQFRCLQ